MLDYSSEEVEAVIRLLNSHLEWGLSETTIQSYAVAITALRVPKGQTEVLCQVIVNYHLFHALVHILQDKQHPRHDEEWRIIEQYVHASTASRNLIWSRDAACAPEDIFQTVLLEIVDSIKRYKYRSALRTWMYSLIVQRAKRYHRDTNAGKRSAPRVPLDQASDVAYGGLSPEAQAEANDLYRMIRACLADDRNKKLPAILFSRFLDDETATEIGKKVALHPSRVRALLAYLRVFLSAHPLWLEWFGEQQHLMDEAKPDSDAHRQNETDDEAKR